MKIKTRFLKVPLRAVIALPICISLTLTACGGGGGGGGSINTNGPSVPQEPVPSEVQRTEVVKLTQKATFNTPTSARGLFKDGNILYVADKSSSLIVLQIVADSELIELASIDLATVDPENTDLTESLASHSLAKSGDYLYVASQEGGLVVVDVSDPASPTPVYYLDTPDKAYFITIDENQLYLTDRQGLLVFDISDPSIPYQAGAISSDVTSFMRSVLYKEELYVAGYSQGLKAFSVPVGSDPMELSVDKVGNQLWSIRSYRTGGKDYFLLGGQITGLIIYDIENETELIEPLPLTSLPNPSVRDQVSYNIVTKGHFAFVADGKNGVKVVSLQAINGPYIAGSWSTNSNGETRDIIVEDELVIVADSSRGVHLMDFEILPDTDGDGVANEDDDFPANPAEWADTDGDGIGNNEDEDDDNDGLVDSVDNDKDNDGIENDKDMFPEDPDFWIDSDEDGLGDNEELLVVDNESIHSTYEGDWALRTSNSSFIESSYLVKSANSDGARVHFNPIIKRPGHYNAYAPRLFFGNPAGKPQVATYNVEVEGVTSEVYYPKDSPPNSWNFIGDYYFPAGNASTVSILDDGDGSADIYADGVWLIPSLTVPDDYDTNNGYRHVGSYTNPDLLQWNLKRLYLDTVDPDYLYAAFNQTADICSINISDPTKPTLVECYVSSDGAGYEIVRKGRYLILANRGDGISVFESFANGNFSNTPIITVATDDKASRLHLDGNLLYVGDTLEGTRIYNVADPTRPVLLSVSEIGAESRDIKTKGNLAYVANYFKGLTILNVDDPEQPELIYRLNQPDNSYQGGVWDLELTDTHLFMLVQSFGVQIADISNPVRPVVISEIRIPDGLQYPPYEHADQPPLDILLVNSLLVVSNGAHGVLLFDVEDLQNIKIVDRIDTPSIAGEAKLRGDFLYVADGKGSGLQIYEISQYSYLYDAQ